jgi:ribose transport system ATP-binding protein
VTDILTGSDVEIPTLALEIEHVSKTFGGTRALQDFSLTVAPGEVHAIVGQNGSGKSTLVKGLSGYHAVDDDDASSVIVAGRPVQLHDSDASRSAGLRFVHQDLGLVSDLNAIENLALGRGYRSGFGGKIHWKQEAERARQSLREIGFTFDVLAPVRTLQASERTGIAVARAIDGLEDVRVLVIDEPTATLPQAEVAVLFAAIERVRARGVGIIYISHRLEEIFAIANRVTVLRDGRRIGTYAIDEIDADQLITRMLGDENVVTKRERRHESQDVVLSVEGLCGATVLDVDMSIQAGEIVGIAGLTGSGRDEFSSLLFGARPREGTVRIAGREVPPNSPAAAIRAGVGFVPPDRRGQAALDDMTVEVNCTITDLRRHSGPLGRLRRSAERREVEKWIHSLNIRPPRLDALFAGLSGGNQQKVILARWLRMAPRLLLLDEPTQGVDVAAKAAIHQFAIQVADGGAAVLVASSDEEELCALCDRVLVLRDGEISGEVSGEAMTPKNILRLHQ